jgi:hypothetical protein
MSEINSIAQGTYTLGQTSATTYQAGPGITVDSPSEGTVRISNDETVLWENSEGSNASDLPVTLTESIQNFEKVAFYWQAWSDGTAQAHTVTICMTDITTYTLSTIYVNNGNLSNIGVYAMVDVLSSNGTSLSHLHGFFNDLKTTTVSQSSSGFRLYKVVGINRISGGNA